ncbi:MAG: glycosyl transferase family 36, partial [Candidatus Bipolaricaulota bacterium]
PTGFDCDKEAFLGAYGSVSRPQAAAHGKSRMSDAACGDPVASLSREIEMSPLGQEELVFLLGTAGTRAEAVELVQRYWSPGAGFDSLGEMKARWDELLASPQVETPDPAFDVMVNVWLKYQALSGRIWGRAGYYQPGGAYGFRDQLQDSQIFLGLGRPEQTLAQLLLHARHQFADGTVQHWWHPLAEEGPRTGVSDDLLWLPFVACQYVRETGDLDPLGQQVPFLDEGQGTLYEHCTRAIERALLRFSPRGLPLIGDGDWNDGLSSVGRSWRGESVWLAHFLHFVLNEFAALARHSGDRATADRYVEGAGGLRESINAYAWDGEWYVRATDDAGRVLGSHACEEGRIFLNPQTWAVIAGTASPERAAAAMQAVDQLLNREYGPVLCWPAYSQPDPDVGYLSRYAPGVRENGGTYTHAATWAVLAYSLLGQGEKAYRTWCKLNPVLRGQDPALYQAEPYVTPGNVAGPESPCFGQGGWTWYTGSAAWLFKVALEGILGVRPQMEGLLVRPCLPNHWPGYRLRRPFRGALYEIEVERRPDAAVARTLTVDGATISGELVPPFADGRVHKVHVVLGRGL